MHYWEVVLKHDNGRVALTTNATDAVTAIETVCKIELAPKRAVISVKKIEEVSDVSS